MDRATGYLILSHHDPSQAERLARTIVSRTPRAHVLIAHDARTSPPPRADHARVRVWTHGLRTDWGSWELVQATVEGFRRLRTWARPELVVFASGQDYVCGDLADWEARFLEGGGGWVGSAAPLDYQPRWGSSRGTGDDAWTRYHYRWFDVPHISARIPWGPARRSAQRVRDAVFLRVEPVASYRVMRRAGRRLVGLRARGGVPLAQGRPVYKGQQMVAMDGRLLDLVLQLCADGTPLARHFRRTVIPDEAMIQTVLSWETPPRRDLTLTYVSWDPVTDGSRWLDVSDLPRVLASGAALCRKVSSHSGAALCDGLDAHHEQLRWP